MLRTGLFALALTACAAPVAPVRARAELPAAAIARAGLERGAPPAPSALRAAIRAAIEPEAAAPARAHAPEESAPVAPLVRAPAAAPPSDGAARIPPETVQRVVRKAQGRFRDCYRQALLRNPALEGRMVVQLSIRADGRVARAEEAEAALADRALRSCLLERFFELEFPVAASPPRSVRYPLVLRRRGAGALDSQKDANRSAAPPPPGFAEAMARGQPVTPPAPEPAPAEPAPRVPSGCSEDDPMCEAL